MSEILILVATSLGVLISSVTIIKFLFYTKSEIDKRFSKLKDLSDERDLQITHKIELNQKEIKNDLLDIKEHIYEKMLEAERNTNKLNQELYERLSQTKQSNDETNQHVLELIAQVKHDYNQTASNLTQFVNTMKDELKNDYIARYNELLKIIGTKVNNVDFERLEAKFDRMNESFIELKTVVQAERQKDKK